MIRRIFHFVDSKCNQSLRIYLDREIKQNQEDKISFFVNDICNKAYSTQYAESILKSNHCHSEAILRNNMKGKDRPKR
jgi:hypothetical protein